MPLLAAADVSHHYAGPVLLDHVSVQLERGQRVGLVGRNGTGKSTLLRILAGELAPSEGRVVRPKGVTVGYQAQELSFAPGTTVWQALQSVFAGQRAAQQRLADLAERLARGEDVLAEYAAVAEQHERTAVHDADQRLATLLDSLGLPERRWHERLDGFSGGERNVVGLARVLLAEPDVMLLDEPGNHLDLDALEWFTQLLRRTRAAVLMVSHDRHLLDATATDVWELRGARITSWSGGYSDFVEQKALADARQERQHRVQQRLIERLQFQARRLRDMAAAYDDPGQARRAKAMLKRIEQMEVVERPEGEGRTLAATLAAKGRHGSIALSIRGFSFAFGERVLFDDASLEIAWGERVCLLGPNGSGKSTLLRQVLERGSWDDPVLRLGKAVKVGEYRQLHDVLDARATLLDWAQAETGLGVSDASALLHRFLFTRDDLARAIGTLSGGEKSRLQLARLVAAEVNFLVLDEPTNHLDIPACEQLEEILDGWEGTLLVVSHDRFFLDRLVQRVVEVRDGGLVSHPMGFTQWWSEGHGRRERRKGALRRTGDEAAAREAEKAAARAEHERRREQQREVSRLRSRLEAVERLVVERETLQRQLEQRLAALYAGGDPRAEAPGVSRRLAAVQHELVGLLAEWERLGAALED